MRGFLRSERGVALVWLLAVVPLAFAAVTYAVTLTQAVTATDVDLQGAIEEAARAAAMQVTADSQAAGDPRVDPARAHAAFRAKLAKNLGLDGTTLAPLVGSELAQAPSYVLVVYNGDDAYAAGGAPAGRKYVSAGGAATEYALAGAGLPYTFGVAAVDVVPGGGGAVQTELKSPGVVVVVAARLARVVGRGDVDVVRWAAARVVVRR